MEVIGAANIFPPRSSRTAMKFPRLAKLGRSVPMRCAMNAACVLASFLDEHSCPIKSWARISPTKSKKNRFMIARQKWGLFQRNRPCSKRNRIKVPRPRKHWRCPHGSLPEDDPLPKRPLIEARPNRSSVHLLSVPRPELPRLESRNQVPDLERHATAVACAAVSCASGNLTALTGANDSPSRC